MGDRRGHHSRDRFGLSERNRAVSRSSPCLGNPQYLIVLAHETRELGRCGKHRCGRDHGVVCANGHRHGWLGGLPASHWWLLRLLHPVDVRRRQATTRCSGKLACPGEFHLRRSRTGNPAPGSGPGRSLPPNAIGERARNPFRSHLARTAFGLLRACSPWKSGLHTHVPATRVPSRCRRDA